MEGESGERPRDAEVARQAILTAANAVFEQNGFDGARVDDIARLAGYNKALIFRYFGDKLGLYRAVVARFRSDIEAELGRILVADDITDDAPVSAKGVRQFLRDAIGWSFDHYCLHPEKLRLLTWEAAERWQTYACVERDAPRWAAPVRRYLERARDAGILHPWVDPVILIANIISISQMYHAFLPRYRLLFPDVALDDPAMIARAREQMIRLVLHGIMTEGEGDDHATGI